MNHTCISITRNVLATALVFITMSTDIFAQDKPTGVPAEIIFCENTDNDFNPIKPVTSINSGEGVNFLARLDKGIGVRFFIWAVFEIKSDTDEVLYKDMQESVDNITNRWFATVQKTIFTKPGKYAIYMLPQNASNSSTTVNKPAAYYAKGILTVK